MEDQTGIQSDPLHAIVAPIISGGETIRWLGKPDAIHAAKKAWIMSVAGIFFGAVIFFILSKIASFDDPGFSLSPRSAPSPIFGLFFTVIAVIFAIAVLRFVFAPLWEYLLALGKAYVITDQRAIIIERFPSENTKSYYPKDIKYVQVKGQEIGNITFNSEMKMVTHSVQKPGSSNYRTVRRKVRVDIGFFNLPEPAKAAAFLRELKNSQQQSQQIQ